MQTINNIISKLNFVKESGELIQMFSQSLLTSIEISAIGIALMCTNKVESGTHQNINTNQVLGVLLFAVVGKMRNPGNEARVANDNQPTWRTKAAKV